MLFETWNWLRLRAVHKHRRHKRQQRRTRRAATRHRRIFVEPLEDRSLLAQLVNVGTATDVIYNLPATASTVFLEDDGTSGNGMLQLRTSSGTFETTAFANPTGSLTINRGNAADTITINALPDFTAGFVIGSESAPLSTITFAGAINLGANKSLTGFATGSIRLPNATSDISTSGNGAISLTTSRDIALLAGSSITTTNGPLALSANQQSTPTAANFQGVLVEGAVVQATGAGAVSVSGRGGNTGPNIQHGVLVNSSGTIRGANGDVRVVGVGHPSDIGGAASAGVGIDGAGEIGATGNGNVFVQGTSGPVLFGFGIFVGGAESAVTSNGGNVTMVGSGLGSQSHGVFVFTSARISAGGTGDILIQGTGSANSSDNNHGVALLDNTSITTSGGDIVIEGQGGGGGTSSASNVGVLIDASQVSSGGSGSITLRGTGGAALPDAGLGAEGNFGVQIKGTGSAITSSDGNVQIIGIEGAGTLGAAISVSSGTVSTLTQSGAVTFVGNSMRLEGSGGISANANSSVTLRPYADNAEVIFGNITDAIGGPLALMDAELVKITAGTINIGNASSGAITVSADITRATATNTNLVSGGAIIFSGGLINTAGGNLSLTPGIAASVSAAKAGTDVNLGTTGRLSFAAGSDLAFAINGTTVDTQYQQLNVVGAVDLTGVDLVLSGSYSPAIGDSFVLVNNDGTDAVTGTFNGLPEGSAHAVPTGTLAGAYEVTYLGGDGNDVVLTKIDSDPVLDGTSEDDAWLVKRSGANTEVTLNGSTLYSITASALTTLTINGVAGNDTLTVDLSAGDVVPDGGLFYNGGDPTIGTGDKLIITDGDQGTVTYNYSSTNAHDGSVAMSNFGTIIYTGLEPIVNSGTATDIIINLPAGPNTVTLGDDGVVGNSLSRLSGGTFEQTDFVNPTGSLTINRGNTADNLTVHSLPDFSASLAVGDAVSPLSLVKFTGPLTLATNMTLTASGQSIATFAGAPLTTNGGDIALSAISDITLDDTLVTNGGNITLQADSDANGQGLLTIISHVVGTLDFGAMLTAADGAAGDIFGARVALSGDGNTALISSYNDDVDANSNQGSVTAFVRNNGIWNQQQQLIMTGGAPSDQFGLCIALSADGNTAIVGSSGDNVGTNNDQGSATVFVRVNGVWIEQQMLVATDGAVGDHFGFSAALSADGNTAIVGQFKDTGTTAGSAYVFTRSGNVWTQQQRLSSIQAAPLDRFGYSVALSSDGNTALVGAEKDDVGVNSDQGTATVFTRSLGVWTEQQQLFAQTGSSNDFFGHAVSLSANGNTALIGSPVFNVAGKGAARIFTLSNGVWTEVQKLTAASSANGDGFGMGVALSADGNAAVIGIPGLNSSKGSAAVFTSQGGAWIQQQLLSAENGAAGDRFGTAVAVSQNATTALVGANNDDIGPNTDQGSAFVFFGDSASQAIIVAGNGNVTLVAADLDIRGAISSNNRVSLSSLRPDSPINLGSTVPEALNLSDEELDRITTGTLAIGTAVSGPITISADMTRPASTVVKLASGSSINFAGGSIDTSGGQFVLTPGGTGSVGVATEGVDAVVGSGPMSFGSGTDLAIRLQGTTDDTEYQQLHVVGQVNLTGVELVLSGSFDPAAGDKFVVVNNDGEDDIIGEFNDLPEGEIFSIESGALAGNYRITYFGGDGNDVVITAVNVTLTFDHLDENYSTPDENPVTHGPAGEFVAEGWATNVSVGPANEAGQGWEFEVSNDLPGLFTAGGQPRVDEDGTLRFTPMPNAYGIANVTVVLHDNGGGTNTSQPVSFQIEITKPRKLHNSAEAGQRNGLDVTGSTTAQPDGVIVAGDVLAVINYINAKGSGPVGEQAAHGPPYCDVNGDNQVAADDVIKIINYINAGNEAEAEAGSVPQITASTSKAPYDDLFSLLAADTANAQTKRRRTTI